MFTGILPRAHFTRRSAWAGAGLSVATIGLTGMLGGHRSLRLRNDSLSGFHMLDIKDVCSGRPYLLGEVRPLAFNLTQERIPALIY
ncbi:hypothetical protein ABIE45_003470 [Methylobacterium sp. OAE515]